MALSGVEYLEVCGPEPRFVSYAAGKIIAMNIASGGLASGANYSVMDCSTGESKLYTLSASIYSGRLSGVHYGGDGYWYYQSGYIGAGGWGSVQFWRIKVADASESKFADLWQRSYGGWFGVVGSVSYTGPGSYRYKFDHSTNTLTEFSGGGVANLSEADDRIFGTSGASIQEYDLSTFTVSNTTATLASPIGRGRRLGDILWFNTLTAAIPLVGLDLVNGGAKAVVSTPSGFPTGSNQITEHSDGYIYRIANDNTTIVVLDPATGRWATDSLPTTRARRYGIVSDGTNLWVPSGEPLDRS